MLAPSFVLPFFRSFIHSFIVVVGLLLLCLLNYLIKMIKIKYCLQPAPVAKRESLFIFSSLFFYG